MQDVDIVIVGSGFSGLCSAIRLKQEGKDDFVVLERGDGVGGTWHYNTYPGCGCDVPSHLYSFSFAPKPDWSQTYSLQPEIGAYLRDCAERFGVTDKIRLNTTVIGSRWDDDERRWHVETDQGTFRARVLISGTGPLAEPKVPALEGIDEFEGETFHSARWNHDYDLEGKRVASIGTGASAIQYVPAIQPKVDQLHVFQRTPPWIFPHTNRRVSRLEKRLYRAFPAAQKLVRGGVYAGRETFVLGFVKQPKVMKVAEVIARAHMKRGITKPGLREKVTPDYTIGCKRILPSNKWYPALSQPNVDLVEGGVERVTRKGVVGADGVEREVDAIIFGTGFEVTDMPVGKQVRGRDGRTLEESWDGSPRTYLGTAAPGFPNLFLLLGPNTGLGHSSMVYMIESQVEHVVAAIKAMDEHGAETAEVRRDVVDEFNREVDERHEGAVWNTGCMSWYLDDTGRNATLWPDWTFQFRRRAREFDPGHYELTPAPTREREAVPA